MGGYDEGIRFGIMIVYNITPVGVSCTSTHAVLNSGTLDDVLEHEQVIL